MTKPFTAQAQARVLIAQDVLALLEAKRINPVNGKYISLKRPPKEYTQQFAPLLDIANLIKHDSSDEHRKIHLKELKQKLEAKYKAPAKCEVCGIGALFVATVDRHDELKLFDLLRTAVSVHLADDTRLKDALTVVSTYNEYIFMGDASSAFLHGNKLFKYLSRWFSIKQLKLIEIAFEGSTIPQEPSNLPSRPQIQKAFKFYETYYYEMSNTEFLAKIMRNIIKNKGSFRP